jgi:uncharacterized protein
MTIISRTASDAAVTSAQVLAVKKLFDDGCTVPFIARYRKEAHGNLDEVKIAKIQERLVYYGELQDRKAAIIKSIDEQGKLTDELKSQIEECFVKSRLEDLYQPYKPKRRTRAQVAKEKGYEPLADAIWEGGELLYEGAAPAAEDFQFARDIIAERIADMADIRGAVRHAYEKNGVVHSEVASPKPKEPTKFEQYYDFSEPIAAIPSHRYLAIRRGQAEKVLWVRLEIDAENMVEKMMEILENVVPSCSRPGEARSQVELAARDAFKRLLSPSCEIDVTVDKKSEADRAAVEIFAENLRHLLLASPLGEKAVLAIDPGVRTGCKVAVLDSTGKYLGKTVIFPMQNPLEAAKAIAMIVAKYRIEAVAIGNGTAGRETESFVRDTLKKLRAQHPEIPIPMVVSVSEQGASIYSASEIARKEFPDLDLTVRGAISIGRRLQDPLAELVKIDPKSIGVGQYQHDVSQTLLAAKLDEVVISCVNGVGVELNTASAPLLERVSGLSPALAKAIVEWREKNGKFASRKDLLKVKGLGEKAYEQCAGFLRIRGAENPLDSSAVHPESYSIVEKMASDAGLELSALVGNQAAAGKIDVRKYITPSVGEPTLRDIVSELAKPGRDPRDVFEAPAFREDVMKIEDVREGMKLEGVVTNVTAFGAFVDIGVHQDGLIHLSELSDSYVSDPSQVVKTGDKIKVTVISVDVPRARISLSAKTNPVIGGAAAATSSGQRQPRQRQTSFGRAGGFSCNPFANL